MDICLPDTAQVFDALSCYRLHYAKMHAFVYSSKSVGQWKRQGFVQPYTVGISERDLRIADLCHDTSHKPVSIAGVVCFGDWSCERGCLEILNSLW